MVTYVLNAPQGGDRHGGLDPFDVIGQFVDGLAVTGLELHLIGVKATRIEFQYAVLLKLTLRRHPIIGPIHRNRNRTALGLANPLS